MRLIKFFIFSICFIITSSGFAQTDIQRLDKILEQVKQTVDANPAKCLELCNEGLKINKQVGLAKFDGKFYGYLGILYQDLGNYQKAVDCLLKSRKAALESNDQQALISAEVNIGGVYFYEGKYEEALKQFIHAGEMARNFKDYTQAGSIVGNIAAIHLQLKQYDKALAYFQLAEKDFIISHDSDMLATNYQNVGQVLSQTFRYDTALKLLQVALDIAKKKQNETIQARININIGSIYIELKQYGKAKIYIEEALALHEHQGDSNYLVDAYCNLSEVNRMLGQKDIALDAGKHAFDIASRLRSNHWLQIACANLDKAYSAFGDYKNAYQYGQLSAAYNDSILNEQKTKEIQKLQIGFETKKKEQEIAKLNNESELKDKQLWLIIGSGIIIVLLICVGTFVLYKNKRKTELLNTKLMNANTVKDRMFSIISHDLRSPLNSLSTLSFLLDHKALKPEEYEVISQRIKVSLSSTDLLLDNMLLWAASQMDGVNIKKTTFDLYDIIEEVKELFAQSLQHKNIHFNNQIKPKCDVETDANMIRIVVRNIISNAIKFTPKGGNIAIAFQRGCITITDTGAGLPQTIMDKLNTPDSDLSLESNTGTQGEKGTGLGLFICKELMNKVGGSLKAEIDEGGGSKFNIEL